MKCENDFYIPDINLIAEIETEVDFVNLKKMIRKMIYLIEIS